MLKKVTHFFLYRIFLRNFLRIIFGISYKNSVSFKKTHQFIVVANHNSHMDTAAILAALPTNKLTKVFPVAARDYFGKNALSSFATHFFINTLLIDRNREGKRQNPLEEMDKILKNGHSILIFPEGSRGEAEVLQDFKHGAAILLKKNPGLPFIPIFLKGMGKALPKGDPFLLPMECQVRIGEPVFIDDIENKEVPDITNLIRENILRLQS